MNRGWVLALVTLACGPAIDEQNFARERQIAYCDRLFDCASATSVGTSALHDCYADLPIATGATACSFDHAAAVDCVRALEDAACQDILDPYFSPPECDAACR